jgi:hypothetical protein
MFGFDRVLLAAERSGSVNVRKSFGYALAKMPWIPQGGVHMRVIHWAWGVAFLAVSGVVHAGDIYVCKGTHGEKVYQSTPCPTPDKQVDHRKYDPSIVRAADGSAGATERVYTSAASGYGEQMEAGGGYSRSGGVRYSSGSPPVPGEQASPPPAAPKGYRCTAGNRTWVQQTPCPSTYAGSNFVDVDGHLMDGTPVHGTGFMHVDKPVQQQLDNDALCEQVRSGARIGQGGGSDASQSYERNKLKRNLCGG